MNADLDYIREFAKNKIQELNKQAELLMDSAKVKESAEWHKKKVEISRKYRSTEDEDLGPNFIKQVLELSEVYGKLFDIELRDLEIVAVDKLLGNIESDLEKEIQN